MAVEEKEKGRGKEPHWAALCQTKKCDYISEAKFKTAGDAYDFGVENHIVKDNEPDHTIEPVIVKDSGLIKHVEWDLINTSIGEQEREDYY